MKRLEKKNKKLKFMNIKEATRKGKKRTSTEILSKRGGWGCVKDQKSRKFQSFSAKRACVKTGFEGNVYFFRMIFLFTRIGGEGKKEDDD